MTKSNLVETKQTLGSIISNCICVSENCSTTSSPFFPFRTLNLFSFQMHLPFYKERYFNFTLMPFLWYIDSVWQFWGPRKVTSSSWVLSSELSAALQAESLQLEAWGLLLPSIAYFISGRQHCPTTLFSFYFLLTDTFHLLRCTVSSLYCAMS